MYFANARRVFERIKALALAADPLAQVLVIDLSAVPDMEVTAVLLVDDLDRDLAALGIELWLCSVIERPLVMLHRSGTADRLHDRLFSTVGEAVEHFSRHQDMDDVSEPDR